MKMIQPFGDRVLVKVEAVPQQTASGIYLPDTVREAPGEGKIVAIGEGSSLQERLSQGDQILFQKHAGTEIKLGDETYVLLAEADILGRVIEVERVGLAV
jgi:chaperonin GroES